MASIWGELKRRNVVKVAVAYAVVGWLLVQIADVFFPALQLPDWTVTFVAALLILGLPVALLLSWAYELTPEGVKRTKSVPLSESITRVTRRKLDFVIIGLLALAVVFMYVDNYLPESGPFTGAEIDPASLEPTADEISTSAESVADEPEVLPNSVAVLPLENLSPDPDNAYFAAGMHEEILNNLVKLRSLHVISRTSVLRYAEARPPIPEIAAELNVRAIVEGSVRFDGETVLVQAQLIDAATDGHLWSDRYERELADIFDIQADIARNIAVALEAELSDVEQESIEQIPTSSPAAYSLYLRALATRAELNTSVSELRSTIGDLDRAVELDPQFALAYAYKATLLANRVARGRAGVVPDWEAVAEEAAVRALALDPKLAWAHAAMGGLYHTSWREREAQEAFELAYQLSPNDIATLRAYAFFKWDTGQYEDALQLGLRVNELDPNGSQSGDHFVGLVHLNTRDYEAAEASFRRSLELNPANSVSQLMLARVAVARGDHAEGTRELETAEQLFEAQNFPTGWTAMMAEAYGRAGRPSDALRLIAELERREQIAPIDNADWALAALAMGEYEEAMRRVETAIENRELTPGVLQTIQANIYQDPALEETQWRELRDQIHPLD